MDKQNYTRWQRFSNWFYYNKWYLAIGALVLYVAGTMIWNVLGIGQIRPDYRIAYVGSRRLPEDCVTAMEDALAPYGEDVNGDGRVCIRLTQHITADAKDVDNAVYGYAAEVTVLADITQGESYFFLLEDPDKFQLDFQILACLDGSIPTDGDYAGMDKVYPWQNCPALSGLELGSYTDSYLDVEETGFCQDLLQNLYLGRRFFWNSDADQHQNEMLWQRLTQGAVQ